MCLLTHVTWGQEQQCGSPPWSLLPPIPAQLNPQRPLRKMLQTQLGNGNLKKSSSGYLGANRSTRHCPAPGTSTLKLHQSFLLSTKKPHKNQKSPTKSLKVMISKAISSQALNSLVLGSSHVPCEGVGRRQRRQGRQGRQLLLWPSTCKHPACHIPSSCIPSTGSH